MRCRDGESEGEVRVSRTAEARRVQEAAVCRGGGCCLQGGEAAVCRTCAHLWKLPPCRAEDLRSAAAFHRETVSIRDSEPNAALARDLRGRGDLTRHPARPASFGLQG